MYIACILFGFRLLLTKIAMNIKSEPPNTIIRKLKWAWLSQKIVISLYILFSIYNIAIFWYPYDNLNAEMINALNIINIIIQIMQTILLVAIWTQLWMLSYNFASLIEVKLTWK